MVLSLSSDYSSSLNTATVFWPLEPDPGQIRAFSSSETSLFPEACKLQISLLGFVLLEFLSKLCLLRLTYVSLSCEITYNFNSNILLHHWRLRLIVGVFGCFNPKSRVKAVSAFSHRVKKESLIRFCLIVVNHVISPSATQLYTFPVSRKETLAATKLFIRSF